MQYKKIPGLILFISVFITACQKEISFERPDTVSPAPIIKDDTSNIATLIYYSYYNGSLADSITYRIKNSTLNGEKKILVYISDNSGDLGITVYNYNANGQLIEINYKLSINGISLGKDLITWNINNRVSKFQHNEMVTSENFTYDISYQAVGQDFRITALRTPQDTISYPFGIADPNNYSVHKSELFVNTQLQPLYLINFARIVGSNGTERSFDTTKTVFNFDAASDLIRQDVFKNLVSTSSGSSSVTNIFKDTVISAYQRNNTDNRALRNIYKSIYGDTLLTLIDFMSETFIVDNLTTEMEDITGNHLLNTSLLNTRSSVRSFKEWINGTVVNSGKEDLGIDTKYVTVFDNKNRPLTITKFEDILFTGLTEPVRQLKIIYP